MGVEHYAKQSLIKSSNHGLYSDLRRLLAINWNEKMFHKNRRITKYMTNGSCVIALGHNDQHQIKLQGI